MRSLLHVSPIEANKPMLLANMDYFDDHCAPNVEEAFGAMWEVVKKGHAGRAGHNAIKGSKKNVRRYHTLKKVQCSLQKLDEIRHLLDRPDMVEMAIWFHDVIYDTTKPHGESERLSAELLTSFGVTIKEALAVHGHSLHNDHALGRLAIDQLARWILETRRHMTADPNCGGFSSAAPQEDFNFFIDMDVMVLALEESEYETYARDVRREYQHIPLAKYKVNRVVILKSFLEMDTLFRTSLFRDQYEADCRRNIQWEISKIEQGNFPNDPMDEGDFVDTRARLLAKMDVDKDGKISKSEWQAMHGVGDRCDNDLPLFHVDVTDGHKQKLPENWVYVRKRGQDGFEYVNTATKVRQAARPTS